MSDLEQVIEDSIEDATTPETETVEAAPEADVTPDVTEPATEEPTESLEVQSPAAKAAAAETPAQEDEFAKKHGLAQPVEGQRENRIPYSRMKKIVENAEQKAVAPLRKEFDDYKAQVEPKVKDYEERLTSVAKFEEVMVRDHRGFVRMLVEKVPGYAQLFEELVSMGGAKPSQEAPAAPVAEDMPQPDQKLADGSMVYSMEGLKALMAWQANQVKSETLKQVEAKYAPIQQDWEAQQRYAAMVPMVQKQIDKARTWPMFTENEEEITKVLAADNSLSLEGAYRQVVVPKFQTSAQEKEQSWAEREKAIREETRTKTLAELRKAPSTSAPTSGTKPRPASQGPRSLEDVIAESIQTLRP